MSHIAQFQLMNPGNQVKVKVKSQKFISLSPYIYGNMRYNVLHIKRYEAGTKHDKYSIMKSVNSNILCDIHPS